MRPIPFFALLFAGSLLMAACQTASSPGTGTTAASAPAFDAPEFGDAFWAHWGDGQAELTGYDLTFARYREQRRGTAVAIFVTETFSNELRVKAEFGWDFLFGPGSLQDGTQPNSAALEWNLQG